MLHYHKGLVKFLKEHSKLVSEAHIVIYLWMKIKYCMICNRQIMCVRKRHYIKGLTETQMERPSSGTLN